ncbi:MAG: hypothetical protein ACLVEV_01725 [Lachnospiraceae bacterium]
MPERRSSCSKETQRQRSGTAAARRYSAREVEQRQRSGAAAEKRSNIR